MNIQRILSIASMWLCRHGVHDWVSDDRTDGVEVFLVRECSVCKARKIYAGGVLGDDEWHDMNVRSWPFSYELLLYLETLPKLAKEEGGR